MSKMYIFPAVACQTPTDLAAHLAHSPYHRTRENGSPGATSSAAYSSRNSQTRPGGAVRINRSRLIVNNRQIIRNSRASSIASLQYNRHQERRPTTAGLTAHRPAQLRSERQHVPHPKQVPCTGVGRINGPRHFSLQRHVKHNTTPKQRPRRRQEHLLLHTPVKTFDCSSDDHAAQSPSVPADVANTTGNKGRTRFRAHLVPH